MLQVVLVGSKWPLSQKRFTPDQLLESARRGAQHLRRSAARRVTTVAPVVLRHLDWQTGVHHLPSATPTTAGIVQPQANRVEGGGLPLPNLTQLARCRLLVLLLSHHQLSGKEGKEEHFPHAAYASFVFLLDLLSYTHAFVLVRRFYSALLQRGTSDTFREHRHR